MTDSKLRHPCPSPSASEGRLQAPRWRSGSDRVHCRAARTLSRATLLWALVGFVGVQASLSLVADCWRPELRDPEYGYKLLRLRERVAQAPRQPLVLLLGSSRIGVGFRAPIESAAPKPDAAAPIVFNFGLTANGPVMELLCLQRLLADGIRPNVLVIEVLAPLLNQRVSGAGGSDWIDVRRVSWSDLAVLERYATPPRPVYQQWCASHLLPGSAHRLALLSRFAPEWMPRESRQDLWSRVDRCGWVPALPESVTTEERRRRVTHTFGEYAHHLDHFHITAAPDRALRELLTLARNDHMETLLLLMPESSEFRALYPPAAQAQIAGYLAKVQAEYRVPIIDARCWMADADFADGHHLLPPGATAFSKRFGREVLRPFLLERHLTSRDRQGALSGPPDDSGRTDSIRPVLAEHAMQAASAFVAFTFMETKTEEPSICTLCRPLHCIPAIDAATIGCEGR